MQEARRFGTHGLRVIETAIEAVYAPAGRCAPLAHDLQAHHAPQLNALFDACRHLADSGHEPIRVRANYSRALRHWVIARRIGMGTRTPQGTRAFALSASVSQAFCVALALSGRRRPPTAQRCAGPSSARRCLIAATCTASRGKGG